MSARIALFAVAMAALPTAFAANTSVDALSQETGVSGRHIRMIAGARTPYAEYRIVYDRIERQLRDAMGDAAYERLQRGDVAAALQLQQGFASATRVGPPVRERVRLEG